MRARIITAGIAVLLLGCPPPTVLHVFNNTPNLITYCRERSCETIEPANDARVSVPMGGFEFSFTLSSGEDSWTYDVASVREPGYSWPLKTGNHFHVYLQIQPDRTVVLVPPGSTLPVQAPSVQPEGYPLQPVPAV